MSELIDLTGQKFGRLTVIKRGENKTKSKESFWLCKCDRGGKTIVRGYCLRTGMTKSCGCLHKEKTKQANTKHGQTHSRLYRVWQAMKRRCYNKNDCGYKNYGARGIKVCIEWQQFEAFYKWSMVNGYKQGLTIDRINVNGNYEPNNCRWTDIKTQNRNTRANHNITYNGETHCLAEWAEILKIEPYNLYQRMHKLNWSINKIFTTKIKHLKRS